MNQRKFERGDLVKCAADKLGACGIIVEIQPTNRAPSKHMDRVNNSYQNVYYILTDGSSVAGPYFSDELVGVP